MLSQLLKFVRSFFSTFLPAYKLWLSEWAEVCWARCHNFSSVTTSCQSNIHPKAFRQGWSGQIQEGEHAGLWHKLDPQEFVLNQCCHELSIHWRKNINAVLKMLLLLGGCRLCGNNLEIFRGRQKADSWSLLIRLMLQVWFILPSSQLPKWTRTRHTVNRVGRKWASDGIIFPPPGSAPVGFWSDCIIKISPTHHSYEIPRQCSNQEKKIKLHKLQVLNACRKWGSDG